MQYQYAPTKRALGILEVAFYRLFPPLSIIGAAQLGASTFLGEHAYWFFLALPVIDTVRCIMYWQKTPEKDSDAKVNWNRTYYALKAIGNIIASTLIVLAKFGGMEQFLALGEALFVGCVVGLPALEYTIKTFGGLKSENSDSKGHRTYKNGTVALTLYAVVAGLTLLYFYPDVVVSQEPLGWFLLIIANIIPVAGFAKYHNDKWSMGATCLLLTGVALLFASPERSIGFDHHFNTEIGIGLGFVLTGFILSLGRDVFRSFFMKKEEKDNHGHSITPEVTPSTSSTLVPSNTHTLKNDNSAPIRFSKDSHITVSSSTGAADFHP